MYIINRNIFLSLFILFFSQYAFGANIQIESANTVLDSFNADDAVLNGSGEQITIKVTGSSESILTGKLSVDGKQSDVKIVNPNGIICRNLQTENIGKLTFECGEGAVVIEGLSYENGLEVYSGSVKIAGLVTLQKDITITTTKNSDLNHDVDISFPIFSKSLSINCLGVKNRSYIICDKVDIHGENEILNLGHIDGQGSVQLSSEGNITFSQASVKSFGSISISAGGEFSNTESIVHSASDIVSIAEGVSDSEEL